MNKIDEAFIKALSEVGSRGAFGRAMLQLGETMDTLVVVTADLADATRVTEFRKRFPAKFINVGIAEQNMVGIATGLAMAGKTVFATTFAAFAALRSCEQLRTDMGYQKANVKLVGADGGVVMGTLGNTHYALEDISVVRAMPNITLLSPADGLEIYKTTLAAAEHTGPVYIRLTGGGDNPIVYHEDYKFEIGKAITLTEGRNVTLFATGSMVAAAVGAARLLKDAGVSARVVDIHTIKPLDTQTIIKAVHETGLLVTVEEHSIIGGLGAAVAEAVAGEGNAPRLIRIGLPDSFGPIGTYHEQLERYGLTDKHIAEKVIAGLKK
jgi:transketolase